MSNAIENDKKLVLENQYVKFLLESGKEDEDNQV